MGAEAVVENGGVINKLGTYQIAMAAKAHSVPVYVAAESYKFARWEGWLLLGMYLTLPAAA